MTSGFVFILHLLFYSSIIVSILHLPFWVKIRFLDLHTALRYNSFSRRVTGDGSLHMNREEVTYDADTPSS